VGEELVEEAVALLLAVGERKELGLGVRLGNGLVAIRARAYDLELGLRGRRRERLHAGAHDRVLDVTETSELEDLVGRRERSTGAPEGNETRDDVAGRKVLGV
jgi:hypothetical protein